MTKADVAQWMADKVANEGLLPQDIAADHIETAFGLEFVYTNDSGGIGIDKEVLKAFRKLTPNVVWDRSERAWRTRQNYDGPGRQADG